jgi:hypothetical protein
MYQYLKLTEILGNRTFMLYILERIQDCQTKQKRKKDPDLFHLNLLHFYFCLRYSLILVKSYSSSTA